MSYNIGVYDFNNTFGSQTDLAWNHNFFSWLDSSSVTSFCQASLALGRWPLVTLEPWLDNRITPVASTYLSDIVAGKYDKYILRFVNAIKAYNGPIGIRFMHEMELLQNIGRYPWAVTPDKATLWQEAYRRFVSVVRNYTHHMTQKYFVWSPVGQTACINYFPGQTFVDFVGCSVYEWDQYVQQFYLTNDGSFANTFPGKYAILSQFGREIMIAEMGIEAQDNQSSWISAMFSNVNTGAYPLLVSLIYFNAPENIPWIKGGPNPNWSISPSIWHV